VGGTFAYWQTIGSGLDSSKTDITVLNLNVPKIQHANIVAVAGDARNMAEFRDQSFDIVHSNSVIEHVGGWRDMRAMAKEISRLGRCYFVQTPYFWFPIEPHARFPCFHWMPESWRYRIILRRTCGFWEKKETVDTAMETILDAVLLDKLQLKSLFPDAEIVSERLFGMTKSIIAIRKE
jgi:hypothetical protein